MHFRWGFLSSVPCSCPAGGARPGLPHARQQGHGQRSADRSAGRHAAARQKALSTLALDPTAGAAGLWRPAEA